MKALTPKKQICQYCKDTIFGTPRYLERPYKKNRGYTVYKFFLVDEGCYLLLEEKGFLDDMFRGAVEN